MSKVTGVGSQNFFQKNKNAKRVRVGKELLSRYKAEEDFLDRIVTGDETWFYYYEPESKTQSKQWKRREEPVPIKELRQAIKHERRSKLTRGVLLQHDNARPHVSSKIMDAIDDLGFECLPHLPYSLDLAPSDYWLFGEMKRPLQGKRFEDFKLLEYEIQQWEKGTPK
ncbi:Transposase [Oopsacas minuta]|uniref:Transposase n=1 Tax=Oopsacas minuta TaxID=111878 RepID=A0AAV7KKH1_9METZ|nr:Transposase [Oopsacas minuta]